MKEINQHLNEIKQLCDANKVKNLFAFGSITKNRLTPNSDIDFVVEIDDQNPLTYSDSYFNLKFQLELLFKRHIDLLEKKAIHNPFLLQQIENNKVLVYGK